MTSRTKYRIILGIRIVLGLLFLLSGAGKLIDGSDAIYLVELMATKFYWLIEYGNLIVISTSIFELILAGLLFWGKKLNWVLLACFLLVAFFTVIVSYFYVQGMSVESCGCFGAFGIGGGIVSTLIRNGVLLVLIIAADATKVIAEKEEETPEAG